MRRIWAIGLMAILTSGFAAPACAQVSPPATPITIPELAAPEQNLGDERKYWVLHKPGVSVDQAAQDLKFCWQFVPHGRQRTVPGFVAFRQADANRPVSYDGGNYGLVGAVIGSIIAGPLERSIRQLRMFRCMVPRGYHRYRVTEDRWKEINQADAAKAIAILAAIAAGPVPPTPRVMP